MLKSNLVFSLRPLFADARKVRQLLFTEDAPDSVVQSCLDRLQDDLIVGLLDYTLLGLVNPKLNTTRMLVFGAEHDFMIDAVDLQATGRAFGSTPVVVPDMGHDMMIDRNWERAAEGIAEAIERRLGLDAPDKLRAGFAA
jgi:non-heme chloroperoxidase